METYWFIEILLIKCVLLLILIRLGSIHETLKQNGKNKS